MKSASFAESNLQATEDDGPVTGPDTDNDKGRAYLVSHDYPFELERLEENEDIKIALQREFGQRLLDRTQQRIGDETRWARAPDGTGVWLSHLIENGKLVHLVLVANDYRYEVRATEGKRTKDKNRPSGSVNSSATSPSNEADAKAPPSYSVSWEPLGAYGKIPYEVSITPSTVDDARRRSAVEPVPPGAGLCLVLIGWTSKAKAAVDASFHHAVRQAESKRGLFGNKGCHMFLGPLLDDIVGKRGPDAQWAYVNGPSSSSAWQNARDESLVKTAGVASAWLARLESMQDTPGTGEELRAIEEQIERAKKSIRTLELSYVALGMRLAGKIKRRADGPQYGAWDMDGPGGRGTGIVTGHFGDSKSGFGGGQSGSAVGGGHGGGGGDGGG